MAPKYTADIFFLDPGEVSSVDDIHIAVLAVGDDVYLVVNEVEDHVKALLSRG